MDYLFLVLTLICIYIILTESYNLVLGYTGMIHVGHVGFMAIGAYASALLTTKAGLPFWAGVSFGVISAAFAGFILALPTVRFRDDYLVAATLGMGQIIRIIILNERDITGGSTGVTKISRPEIFGITLLNNFELFIFTFIVSLLALAIMWRITHCPFGKTLEGIREDEIASASLGKNVWMKKIQVLVLAAAFAGLAGALFAHTTQFIDPDTFDIHLMIYVFLIVVFGGSGKFWGPVLGSIILYGFYESLRFVPLPAHVLGPLRWILFSAVLIAMIILKPKGLLGEKLVRKKL
ncbi:branched-chain amino acid ABC transporter permease [Candidatus Peregrinibacteria bacterium]|nr:branched-chain amino acid ABC transporter permease [Candidatus Peregrinibacteria bacterium]